MYLLKYCYIIIIVDIQSQNGQKGLTNKQLLKHCTVFVFGITFTCFNLFWDLNPNAVHSGYHGLRNVVILPSGMVVVQRKWQFALDNHGINSVSINSEL